MRRSLASEIAVEGTALHAGVAARLRLLPAPSGQGIVFHRTDVKSADIPALWSEVTDTRLNTFIGGADGVGVIEHVMAALAGAEIDDCLIEITGPEPPVLDGAAAAFLELIDGAGVVEKQGTRETLRVLRSVTVEDGKGAGASLQPSDRYSLSFDIDFSVAFIGRQHFDFAFTREGFRKEIAPARTFGMLADREKYHAAGFGRGADLTNTLVFDGEILMNPEMQHFPDEFVRHKILDAMGDLKLAGFPLAARFQGIRSGHALTNRLLHALFADPANYALISD